MGSSKWQYPVCSSGLACSELIFPVGNCQKALQVRLIFKLYTKTLLPQAEVGKISSEMNLCVKRGEKQSRRHDAKMLECYRKGIA